MKRIAILLLAAALLVGVPHSRPESGLRRKPGPSRPAFHTQAGPLIPPPTWCTIWPSTRAVACGRWVTAAQYAGMSSAAPMTSTLSTTGLGSNILRAVAVTPDAAVWFGTWEGGVSRFDGKTWTTYMTSDGLGGQLGERRRRRP